MSKPDRMKFAEYLDKMFVAFSKTTIPEMHRREIGEFVGALDGAKGLLAKIAGEEEDSRVS